MIARTGRVCQPKVCKQHKKAKRRASAGGNGKGALFRRAGLQQAKRERSRLSPVRFFFSYFFCLYFPARMFFGAGLPRSFPGDHFSKVISRRSFPEDHFPKIISRRSFLEGHFPKIIFRRSFPGNHFSKVISRRSFPGDHFPARMFLTVLCSMVRSSNTLTPPSPCGDCAKSPTLTVSPTGRWK